MTIPKRILVVDDEDSIREIVQLSLEMVGGWEVCTAHCGSVGLSRAEAEQPDAILLDVMMPDMDGLTVFNHLQANQAICHIPVILLTAKAQPAEQRRFLELGVKGVLAKPFDPMQLAGQVSQVLGWEE